ncbi:concanavalin A-like lectin/glucanase domain-containing protein [Umbelopsis sp. PMI_123]|nr:concanavalin A-like lectin/glucanase domain-containing protein [Umbelopsis sp. PMI_123]
MTRLFSATSIIFVAISALVRADVPAGTNGFSLVWSDDFTGASNTPFDSNNWQHDVGTGYPGAAANWGTGELEYVTNNTENCYQDGNGNLRLVPLRDSSGGWTSARIESVRDDFMAPPGGVLAVEAKIQLPNVSGDAAAGYFPAFWMLGTPFRGYYKNWPEVGEFDIMENVNGINKVFGTLHCGTSPGKFSLKQIFQVQ